MRDFRKLAVWQKAYALTLATYRASATLPRDEIYGLTGQMRRAAVSIGANIAEGCGREGPAELARFLRISMGSASELEHHLLLAHDLGFLSVGVYEELITGVQEVKRMQTAFLARLVQRDSTLAADS